MVFIRGPYIVDAGDRVDVLARVDGRLVAARQENCLLYTSPEDEDFDTLGGLVYSQLSTIPEDGSHPVVEAYGLHIRVEKLEDRRVEWALVSKAEVKPAAERCV